LLLQYTLFLAKLHGSVDTPTHYGSNGYGATLTSGTGGGYIRIVATEYVSIGKYFVVL
jgi:hypothetical protein